MMIYTACFNSRASYFYSINSITCLFLVAQFLHNFCIMKRLFLRFAKDDFEQKNSGSDARYFESVLSAFRS
jgi:hypothetical protein